MSKKILKSILVDCESAAICGFGCIVMTSGYVFLKIGVQKFLRQK